MKKILIVDDSSYFRDLIKDYIKDYDFEILEAFNGEDALNKYIKYKPDIVTMDIDMPIMNGLVASQKILEFDKNANILMCSTLMSIPYYVKKAYEIGAKSTLAKPYTKIEFENSLVELIEIISNS